MSATITISRLRVYARHGVMEQERRVGNNFEVTVCLRCDVSAAAAADDISLAINYAEVVEEIQRVMAVPRRLLETVATDIRDAICARWQEVKGGSVTVDKLHPPFTAPVERVGVTVEW